MNAGDTKYGRGDICNGAISKKITRNSENMIYIFKQ